MSLTDRLLLFPRTNAIALEGSERVRIDARSGEGRTLDLFRRRQPADAPPAEAYALEFIGNGSRAEWTANYGFTPWPGHRVESYSLNYPGYGQSSGPARLKATADSGLVAYDWLRQRAGDRPIFLVGESLGSAVALHVAAERPEVAGLILVNPPPLRQLIVGNYGWWNLWLAAWPVAWGVPRELDSLANAARCRQPAAFVTSGGDQTVPVAYQQRVAAAYAGPKRVLLRPGADHNDVFDADADAWIATQTAWLWPRETAATTRP